jgi:hypothetical protein
MMSRNFSGPDEPYARLRHAFVYKHKPTRTPPHLSRHRSGPGHSQPGRSRGQETAAVPWPVRRPASQHNRRQQSLQRRPIGYRT